MKKFLLLILCFCGVILINNSSFAQSVEVVDDYPVLLADSINAPLTPEMYFNLQCDKPFSGVMYAKLELLQFKSEAEAEAFFRKCPYPFLNILVIYNQGIARITFENNLLSQEQKNWGCERWAFFFKNSITEQRNKSGIIDFRN